MSKLTIAALVFLTTAGSAQAATTVSSSYGPDSGIPVGQSLAYGFEGAVPAGLSGNFALVTGSVSGEYAAPFGDRTQYLTVPRDGSSGTATLVLNRKATTLSLYWGSIDGYNTISFFDSAGISLGAFTGNQIGVTANGSQTALTTNRRVSFDFGGAQVKTVQFKSTQKAFELDDISTTAVPEPASWAMLIIGMGLIGTILRHRRNRQLIAS